MYFALYNHKIYHHIASTVKVTPDMYRKYIMDDRVSGYGRPQLLYAGDVITLYSKLGLWAGLGLGWVWMG